jgi:hypothetical protein
MTKVVFAPAFRATDQAVVIFHASTRPQNRAELRRDLGAVESRITRTEQRLPLSMSDGIDRYEPVICKGRRTASPSRTDLTGTDPNRNGHRSSDLSL